jgi:hypothetical protein
MSKNPESGARDQIEFVFELTFEKILHVPKRATEIQILWTKGKRTGKTSPATVNANTATWGSDVSNSIKVVSSLFKDPGCSTFMQKSLMLEVVAVQNKKVISTISFCTLNLADYVLLIFDIDRPSAAMQIHEKMAQGCVASIQITAQFCQAKIGDWHPAEGVSSYYRNRARDEESKKAAADASSATVAPANVEKQEQQKTFKASSRKFKIMGPVDERASMYIGDAGVELLLRIFSKYDCDRSGHFEVEHVACMLSEMGQSAVADDLRLGKAALSQSLDIFTSDGGAFGSSLQMNFSSFLSWIAANRLASNLHVARSLREATNESARGYETAELVPDECQD